MTSKRIHNFIEHCKKVRELGISYAEYEALGHTSKGYFSTFVRDLKKEHITDDLQEVLNFYTSGKNNNRRKTVESVDSDHCKIDYVRNEENHIIAYKYEIPIKNKPALCGSFDRNEMNTVYRLYSYYGDSLQQRIVSRQFPELSLIDFKRVLRPFFIY